MLLSWNLILQGFLNSESKSRKLEVTFAPVTFPIHYAVFDLK